MQWTYFVIPKPSNKDRLKDFLQHLILHYSPCKLIPHCFRDWIIVSYIYIITFSRFLQAVCSLNQNWTKYVFKHNIVFYSCNSKRLEQFHFKINFRSHNPLFRISFMLCVLNYSSFFYVFTFSIFFFNRKPCLVYNL